MSIKKILSPRFMEYLLSTQKKHSISAVLLLPILFSCQSMSPILLPFSYISSADVPDPPPPLSSTHPKPGT